MVGSSRLNRDYVDQPTKTDGWTNADEDQLYNVANEAIEALQRLTFSTSDPSQCERSETVDSRTAPVTLFAPHAARPGHTPRSPRTATPAVRSHHRCRISGDVLPPLMFSDRIPTPVAQAVRAQPRTAPSTVVTMSATEPEVYQ